MELAEIRIETKSSPTEPHIALIVPKKLKVSSPQLSSKQSTRDILTTSWPQRKPNRVQCHSPFLGFTLSYHNKGTITPPLHFSSFGIALNARGYPPLYVFASSPLRRGSKATANRDF